MSPEQIRVRVVEDRSIVAAIETDELMLRVPSRRAAAEWYERHFGARVVAQGDMTVAELPGLRIRFEETTERLAGTRGRAVDRIGFDVKDLKAFTEKLKASGVSLGAPYSPVTEAFRPLSGYALVTDPWGTAIELTEGLINTR
jgi:hypothetical protein